MNSNITEKKELCIPEPVQVSETKPNYDIFRDSPLRYLGYANEVGESFRYQFPRIVTPSYVIAFGYCFMDAATTGYNTWTSYDKSSSQSQSNRSREAQTVVATLDTLLWQTFASVMIPGYTINMLVKASRFAVSRTTTLPIFVATWLPTGVGLASIPFIVVPIDDTVDFVLDKTVRLWVAPTETEHEGKQS